MPQKAKMNLADSNKNRNFAAETNIQNDMAYLKRTNQGDRNFYTRFYVPEKCV